MTQSGYVTKTSNRWENYESLKKHLQNYTNMNEFKREFAQTCADAAAAIEEVSGETINAMAASKALRVSSKTDQVGTDGAATGTVTWQDVNGTKTDATFTLNAVDTTTEVVTVAAVTTARFIESFALDAINCADEVLLSNAGVTEIFGVIKVGYHQMLKSGYMAAPSRRTFLASFRCQLSLVTALVSVVCTYTPLGETLSTTKTFLTKVTDKVWEPCIEVEPGSKITWTIEDDNAAHPVANCEFVYIEAWK